VTRLFMAVMMTGVAAMAAAQGSAPQATPSQTGTAQAPAAQATTPAVPAYTPDKNKLSYALGMDIGGQFKERAMDIDPAVFARGMKDSLAGAKTEMTADEARATIAELQKYLAAKQAVEAKAIGDKSRAEGQAYLAANKAKPGVITLPSGLQYKAITTGTGKKPLATDQVVCHYRGTTIDGKEVDSSYKRNEPATFRLDRVIKGWTEVLQLMPVGSKWQVFIPSDLAYGDRGASAIPPNAALIFEIELIGIK
jgi:FKBP-type peptidyl-prolyl cis-trans isomerase